MWSPLTDTDRKMLALEAGHFKYLGAKHDQILTSLHMTPTTYYQRLAELVERPEAQRYDPITCRRVRDLAAKRRAVRSAERMRQI